MASRIKNLLIWILPFQLWFYQLLSPMVHVVQLNLNLTKARMWHVLNTTIFYFCKHAGMGAHTRLMT